IDLVSSGGAVANTSWAPCGAPSGFSIHAMKELIPAWATSPTQDRSSAWRLRYQASFSSRRRSAAVVSRPLPARSLRRVSAAPGSARWLIPRAYGGVVGTPQRFAERIPAVVAGGDAFRTIAAVERLSSSHDHRGSTQVPDRAQ